MKRLLLKVGADDDGKRLDKYLAANLIEEGGDLSRRKLKQVIDVGGVYVNDKRVRIASWSIRRGDSVRVEFSEDALARSKDKSPVFREGDILLDEGGIIAVNKPPGLPAQATLDQSVRHVVPCLATYFKDAGKKHRSLILVHRLDKETSGVLLLADNSKTATWLTDAFRNREVHKTYWAICYGAPSKRAFAETSPLSPIDKKTGNVRPVRSGGKSAVTRVAVVEVNEELGVSLVECHPETGRSHQIRVHLAMNGLPIVGDKRYGDANHKALPRELAELTTEHQFLHAAKLAFVPRQGASPLSLAAPVPERFSKFLLGAGFREPS